MMVDWLHCNTCFHQPGDGLTFFLTNCRHVYCEKCAQQLKNSKCRICGSTCDTITLSGQMKPDLNVYFTNPMDLLEKNFKQVIQVMDFQQNHRKKLITHLKDKLQRQQSIVEKAQQAVKQYQELDREASKLKEENSYLKRLISEKGLGSYNRFSSHGRISPGYRASPTSPCDSRGMTSSRPHSQCPSVTLENSMRNIGSVGRVSVRTPPAFGKIGVTSGIISPQGTYSPLTPKSQPHQITLSALDTPSYR